MDNSDILPKEVEVKLGASSYERRKAAAHEPLTTGLNLRPTYQVINPVALIECLNIKMIFWIQNMMQII